MISGTDFVFKKTRESAGFITMPLLTTADGVKMGKSAGNGVWLDSSLTCVYDFYQVLLDYLAHIQLYSISLQWTIITQSTFYQY